MAGLALLLAAGPAAAHTRLQSSDPADGAAVATALTTVSLVFNESIQAEFANVTVVGPDGTSYQTGQVSTNGGRVQTGVSPLGPAGAYRIGYRVISEDGHPVQGAVAFTLTAAGPGAPAAPSSNPSAAPSVAAAPPSVASAPQANGPQAGADGAPVWPWLVGALALIVIGTTSALRRINRS